MSPETTQLLGAVATVYGLGMGDVPVVVVHAVGLVCGSVTLAVALRLRRPSAGAATPRLAGADQARMRPGRTLPCEPEREIGAEAGV
jgi:hypothetical protein